MSSKLIGQPRCRGSDAQTVVPGPFIRKFRDKFTKQLEALCGVNGEAIVKLCQVNRISLYLTCGQSSNEFSRAVVKIIK